MPQNKITIYLDTPIQTADFYIDKFEFNIGTNDSRTNSVLSGTLLWANIVQSIRQAIEKEVKETYGSKPLS